MMRPKKAMEVVGAFASTEEASVDSLAEATKGVKREEKAYMLESDEVEKEGG